MGDQHSALMNEFKQAHKRMFKNGFKECGGVAVESLENRVSPSWNLKLFKYFGSCKEFRWSFV